MIKILILISLLVSCTKKQAPEALTIFGETMGTTYAIKYYPSEETSSREELAKEVDQVLNAVNLEMSTYIDESEIQKFNGLKSTDSWFKVSPGFHWVTKVALALAQKTDGIYDPTVGPLVDLWGFGSKKSKVVPTESQIALAKKNVGHQFVIVDETEPMIRKTNPQVRLDLSSIAKGWGVDQVGRSLESNGVENYMVEIGGEVRTKGTKADETSWQIGISVPESEDLGSAQKIVLLNNAALATSGDYRNFFESNGMRYAHVIDPRSGAPALSDIASVSVIEETGDCTQADGLATALLAMGTQLAMQFASDNQMAVYLISHNKDGKFTEWMTPEFSKYIKK
tara:strand:- start:77199 stop:78218 length:1020 start_codon:yes stop_codon:yes gene_type:complete